MLQFFYLTWVDENNLARSQSLPPSDNKLLIGRSPTADIIITHPSVSRIHAELKWQDNVLYIKDLNSTFGTLVNDESLSAEHGKPLFESGEIRLGNMSLWYEVRSEEEKQEMLQTCFFSNSQQISEELAPDLIAFKAKIIQRLKSHIGAESSLTDLDDSLTKELYSFSAKQQEQLKEQRILNSISHILNRSNTIAELAKNALNLISKVLSADRGFIVLHDNNKHIWGLVAKRNFKDTDPVLDFKQPEPRSNNAYSNTLIEQCYEETKILIFNDVQSDFLLSQVQSVAASGTRSIVVIPLIQFDEVLGVIYLDSTSESYCFEERQIPFMETFAAHTAIALVNAQLYKRAITDDLTHLYTRKYIDERLEQELDRAKRYHRPFSILMIDLDRFKQVNDTYGHSAGDLVLQTLSYLLRQRLRDTDIAGRIGGEEFIVILGETEIEGAKLFAERIRDEIEKEKIEKGGQVIPVTASIGVACFNEKYLSQPLAIIEDADKALYHAKTTGRNRVVVAGSY
ncbi:MAG: diguanylate cyclase [Kangiellaceae bacterium]|nr:diguanylate cyclase [Kangiellaceae bacterium]MCW8999486.1 diguanylate cyclase [Kangiellaceae bacterium]